MKSRIKKRSLRGGCRFVLYGALLFVAMQLIHVPVCSGQVATSSLTGTIKDQSGAVMPGARVTAASVTTGFSMAAVSGAGGNYTIPYLPPGVYRVTAEASGFKKVVIDHITLQVGSTTTQDIQLQVGAMVQEVNVTGAPPLLNTTSAAIGTVVTGTLTRELPLNGRFVFQLNLLAPGTVHDKSGTTSDAVSLNPSVATFSVNGNPSDVNMYLVDGIEIRDYQDGTAILAPSVDAVQEFQNTTGQYSATMGTTGGAQVNTVVRSGTNKFHGAAWDFLRNDKLDARNFFQANRGGFQRNQFGANLGGPVLFPGYNGHDKSFFFFNYEGERNIKSIPETGFYPTPAELNGDLSALLQPGHQLVDPFTGQAFQGGIIPTTDIRPSTLLPFLQSGIGNGPWIPAPNSFETPGINYSVNSQQRYTLDQEIARLDHVFNDKTSVYGHLIFNSEHRSDPNLNPNWNVVEGISSYTYGGHLSRVITPNFLFSLDSGVSHFVQNLVQSTAFKNDISNKILGLQGMATIPASFGAPVWGVSGFSNLGEVHYGPRQWSVNTWQASPAISWIKGSHDIQAGVQFVRINNDFPEIFRTNGIWSYDGRFSGQALGDFLLGLPASVNTSPDAFAPNFFSTNLAPYIADTWKLTPRLTLDLGLRYELVTVPVSHNNQSVSNIYFPPNNGTPVVVIADGAKPINFQGVQQQFFTGVPFVRASQVGLPESLLNGDHTTFAPRFGFAYRVPYFKDAVFRGGFGIFYATDIYDKFVEASVDPPFVRSQTTFLDSTNFMTFDPTNPTLGASAAAAQIFANQIDHHLGRVNEWNLGLEKNVWNTLFSVQYVGSISDHLPNLRDPNQALPGPGSIVSRRPYPSVGVIYMAEDSAIANYNGLQLKVNHNFSHGFAFLAGYTWSKALNNSDGTFVGEGQRGGTFQNSFNRGADYGLAGQDVRQRVTVGYVWELPVGKGRRYLATSGALANTLLGGWQANGITSFSSGSPLTAFQSYNCANSDAGKIRPDAVVGMSPNDLAHGRPRGQQVAEFFDTSAFQECNPPSGTYRFGTAGRNTIIGPGTFDNDFAMFKNIPIKERANAQFRVEFFNLFNRPIFGQPGTTLGTPQFGTLSSTAIDPREIQLALKLSF
jgi:Carboxypeptidase regulatory-like domain